MNAKGDPVGVFGLRRNRSRDKIFGVRLAKSLSLADVNVCYIYIERAPLMCDDVFTQGRGMMAYSDTPGRDETVQQRSGWSGRRRFRAERRPGAWRPLEIIAMVLGFIVFWPIGLAILGFKLWQSRTGYEGDMVTAVRSGWSYAENQAQTFGKNWGCGGAGSQGSPFRGFGFGGGRPTGNAAFDDWRNAELSRLEEEHRKLEAAEREFADFLANLRKAKDREEFDRFMNQRRGAADQPSA